MQNNEKDVIAEAEKRRITDALDDLPIDVLAMIHRIIYCAESGLE